MNRIQEASVLLLLVTLSFAGYGQEHNSTWRIQIKRMEIPRYLPLAQQAGISGSVALHLVVGKNGEVTSVDVVSSQPHDWGQGFTTGNQGREAISIYLFIMCGRNV